MFIRPVRNRLALLQVVGALLLASACGGGSPTAPSSSGSTSAGTTTTASSAPVYWTGVIGTEDNSVAASIVVSNAATVANAPGAGGLVHPLKIWDAAGQMKLVSGTIFNLSGTYNDITGHCDVAGSGVRLQWDVPTIGTSQREVSGIAVLPDGREGRFTLATVEAPVSIGTQEVFCGLFGSSNSTARGALVVSIRNDVAFGQATDKTGAVPLSGRLSTDGKTLSMSWRSQDGTTGSLAGTRLLVAGVFQVVGTWSNSLNERGTFAMTTTSCSPNGSVS